MSVNAQPYMRDLSPYQPGLPIELVAREYGLDPNKIIKLASNENPLGMSPKAREAVRGALSGAHRYPEQYDLGQALSRKLSVAPEQIVLGNGSNDVLDLAARTFLGVGGEAVSSEFAFAVYSIATQSVGAKNIIVPAKDFGHDLDAMLEAITHKTQVAWIANPNNPTGTFVPYARLKEFLGSVPKKVIVVLDEAYFEYLDAADQADATKWLHEHPNLVIVRTFSKIYGLAGLRIGYAIASPQVAGLLNRVRQPFNANILALAAAVAALEDDEFVERSNQANNQGRAQLLEGLKRLGLEPLPTFGNFVTVKVDNAAEVNEGLLREGVIVRPLAGYGMSSYLRVTVGTAAENDRLLRSFQLCLA